MLNTKNHVKREMGVPDEISARMQIWDACKMAGSKAAFCREIGMSVRYLNLILEWKRSPAHPAILNHFHWDAIYMTPEDFIERRQERRRRRFPQLT